MSFGEPIPQYGGMLDMGSNHGDGLYRCAGADCGWEGIPTYIRGKAQTECPACDSRLITEEVLEEIERETVAESYGDVGRNQPCPCGSGKKFKKCHAA